jgi:hypothetical protein
MPKCYLIRVEADQLASLHGARANVPASFGTRPSRRDSDRELPDERALVMAERLESVFDRGPVVEAVGGVGDEDGPEWWCEPPDEESVRVHPVVPHVELAEDPEAPAGREVSGR